MFKVFQVAIQNLEKKLKYKQCRIFSITFQFQIITFKRSFKRESAWNKNCIFWHVEQLSYWNFFEFQLKILRKSQSNIIVQYSHFLSLFLSCRWPGSNAGPGTRYWGTRVPQGSICKSFWNICSHQGPWEPGASQRATGCYFFKYSFLAYNSVKNV